MFPGFSRLRCRRFLPALIVSAASALRVLARARDFNKTAPTRPLEPILERKAINYYGKLVELWKDADPELQPRVEAARRAISALSPDQ